MISPPLKLYKGPKGGRPHWTFLHKAQMEVYRSPARFKTVVAGRRWGKTQLSKTEMIKEARKKNRLIWYIAPTYQMARQIMWQELIDAIPRRWIEKINESRLEIKLRNRTVIALKGADKPDTLRGVGLHFVVLDEFQDMRPETWDTVIQPTLASTRGRVLFIGTPKAFNHLYDHYMRGQDPTDDEWQSWQFKTMSSPFILPEEIEQARRNMSEKEFAQEFEASFETMSNRVYHAFDRNLHVKRVKFDPRLPILVGMDFNLDPMSAVLFQHDDKGRINVFDEVILRNSNTFEMAEELERRYWRYKKQMVIYPDPAGGQKSTQSRGESDISILRAKGFKKLKYRRKHPRIRDRVNSVNRMLRSADGTVRMWIDHSCKGFINSLEQTQYKKNSNDIDKTMGVEHATDAFGYGCELEHPVRELRVLGVSI
ncbi:MAG: terminase family protein [Rhodobacterales bacterium]|nr:terminase family protein [Rhodobacterales bacterium]